MERLTVRDHMGCWIRGNPCNNPRLYNEGYFTCWDSSVKGRLQQSINKLCDYEDAEEQGRMIILPVPIGTTIYEVYDFDDLDYDIDEHKIRLEDLKDIGDTVFLTRKEAELRLKELEKEKIGIC